MHSTNKKGFTLIELLAVIVILAVVILVATTAIIPIMNRAKKRALVDEALVYLKAANNSSVFDDEEDNEEKKCINVSDLNEEYVKKNGSSYNGVIINNGSSQTINLTDGKYYVVGSGDLTASSVTEQKPLGFAISCGSYNPIIADNTNSDSLAYKLLMNQGGSSLDANLQIIENRSSTVDFNNVETDSSKSGLYKGEDDDGATYYYRGVVNNNWVSFGGFYWRIIRINGDGSVRLIYSGLASSNHTGDNAAIKNSSNSYLSTFGNTSVFNESTADVSGLTSTSVTTVYYPGRNGHTYVGYTFNPKKILMTYPDRVPNTNKRLNYFSTISGLSETKNDYYLFKNFDLNTDCKVGNDYDDTGTCTLKCRSLNNDCVAVNWKEYQLDPNNYSTTADGVYSTSSTTNYIFTSQYKYTCWTYGTPVTKSNSDGTTSVYISCPVVSEIVGTVKDKYAQAKVKYHGLFAPSPEVANSGSLDSNVKKQIDLWYENNILNKKDSSNVHNLEDYLVDEIFCNDRNSNTNNYPLDNAAQSYMYSPYPRNTATTKTPTLKCSSKSRDGYTLGFQSNSTVSSSGKGNGQLKYPVGLITSDEIAYAGGKYNTENASFYLKTGKNFWTMSPFQFTSNGAYATMFTLASTGKLYYGGVHGTNGIRPVINLSKNVLWDSGSGIESDPYIVTLE